MVSAGDSLAEALKPWYFRCDTGHWVTSSNHDEDDPCPAPNCEGMLDVGPFVDPYLVVPRLLSTLGDNEYLSNTGRVVRAEPMPGCPDYNARRLVPVEGEK